MVEATPDRGSKGEGGAALGANTASATASPSTDSIPLPKFLVRQADGLYLALDRFDAPKELLSFVDRLFGSAMRFVKLNVGMFQKMLYDVDADEVASLVRDFEAAGRPATVKFADDMVAFPPARYKLYRDPKSIERGAAAEYAFEPVFVEPQTASSGEASKPMDEPQIRIMLDIDEFIAAMWVKGIRFGIDPVVVKAALAADVPERLVFARARAPKPGEDASVVELLTSMRRDNAPKLLADGRIDLRQFENRFPQVERDTRLIMKVPRTAGSVGWSVAGNETLPESPRDLDIATLAGHGTRVERTAEGEFVVANFDGFLQIDAASQSFSITDKIINTEGVSVRTTGNLALRGDEYEEHGVVQEKAQIEGKHMTFMADVFGDIVSQGGRVVLKKNLVAGSIRDAGGSITVDGNASRATLEALGGDINLQYAENCRIIGVNVSIEKAVFCEVLAQDLKVGSSEGSVLAAQKIEIGSTAARRDVETTISVLIPDVALFAMQIEELHRRQREAAQTARVRREEADAISGKAEMKTFMLLSSKLAAKELTMTSEQAANFQKLMAKLSPHLSKLKELKEDMRAADEANNTLTKKIEDAKREAARKSSFVSCNVAEVAGETVIRTLVKPPDHAGLEMLQPRELRARLREGDADSKILFNGDTGKFSWRMVKADNPHE